MQDHTAHARELLSRNLAKVEAAKQQALLHGKHHAKKRRVRHDQLLEEEEALTKLLGRDPSTWGQDDLHELEQIQAERRGLSQLGD